MLSRAFAASSVRGVFEEFDAILKGPANAARIAADVRQSHAVFIVVGVNVERLKHTRDWVAFETGLAAATALQNNKDVWVIEAVAETEQLSVVIPHLRHYVCLDQGNEWWQGYLTQIIASDDDSHFLKAMSLTTAAGAAIGEGAGALVGAGVGFLLATMVSPMRPVGFPVICPQCASSYSVHLSSRRMRCPVCNSRLAFPEH